MVSTTFHIIRWFNKLVNERMLLDKDMGFSLETWSTQINGDCYYCTLIMCLCLLFDMEDHRDSQRVLRI